MRLDEEGIRLTSKVGTIAEYILLANNIYGIIANNYNTATFVGVLS